MRARHDQISGSDFRDINLKEVAKERLLCQASKAPPFKRVRSLTARIVDGGRRTSIASSSMFAIPRIGVSDRTNRRGLFDYVGTRSWLRLFREMKTDEYDYHS